MSFFFFNWDNDDDVVVPECQLDWNIQIVSLYKNFATCQLLIINT